MTIPALPIFLPRPLRAALPALATLAAIALAPQAAVAQDQPNGQQIFTSAGCTGCHGQAGQGGIGPRLAGDSKLADPLFVAGRILNGGGSMPAFRNQLSPEQIAAVATYVRTSFGNGFGPVTADQVQQAQANGNQAAGGNQGGGQPQGAAADQAAAGAEPSADEAPRQDTMQVGAAPAEVKQPSSSGPDQAALDKASEATDSWLMYNKGYSGERYSSLRQITAANAAQLQPVCIQQLGESSAVQASPVVYKGTLYMTTTYSTFALDAATCRQKWGKTYAPKGYEPAMANRGVAIADGRVVRGTTDGHLLALDAANGDTLWDIRLVDSTKGYFLSSAPIIWKGLVLIGTAGADWGANAQLFAVDAKDGHIAWTFDEIKPDTFGGAEPAATGGGSNWTSYALDTESGLLYVPVGNPAPDFAPQYRHGDNLYTDSILVMDAKTGKLDHYYQQIPNDSHDWDTAAAPILFHVEGSNGKSLYTAVSTKGGYLFAYDESTKKLAYKVPTTTIDNADAPPTQQGTHVCPGITGGSEWNGPAFDAASATLYVPSVDWCTDYKLGEIRYSPGQLFFGGAYTPDDIGKAKGWIRAFDAKTGKEKWKYQSDLPVVAAVTPTAGDVLFSGELGGDFIVLDSKSGKKLYSFYTGGPVAGGIVTYEIDGRQYVAVPSGNQSRTWSPDASPAPTLVIFALPKGTK